VVPFFNSVPNKSNLGEEREDSLMKKYAPLIGCFIVAACGVSSGGGSPSGSETQSAVSGGMSVTVATDSLAEGGSATSGLVEASQILGDREFTTTKNCSAVNGAATVVITRSGTGSKTVTRKKFSMTHSITAGGTETRVWTPPSGQSLSCVSSAKGAAIEWNSNSIVNGLTMTSTVSKTHHVDITRTPTAGGTSTTLKNYTDISGSRTTTWSAPSTTPAPSGSIMRDKSIKISNTTMTSLQTQKDGSELTSKITVSTDSASPLAVTVQRSSSSPYALQQKTVKSGTITVTHSDGALVKSTFANLVYDLTSSNSEKCVPVSGSISGAVFSNSTATAASKTFVLTFGVSTSSTGATIAYDGGTSEDYDYSDSGCDIEREAAGL
jgi:hypothetical protein